MKEFKIKLKRNGGIPESELLEDLKQVAKKIGKSPTMDEYESHGKFGRGVFKKRFGTWNNALLIANLSIIKRGNNTITEEVLLDNMTLVWEKIGKQPSQSDLDNKKISSFGSGSYKKKFGTYNKALESFGEWVNEGLSQKQGSAKTSPIRRRTNRNINLRQRHLVMKRDRFRCVLCGWLPANGTDRELEVDHILPWSRGGETEMNNLQTLCSVCNRGKSNLR